MSGMADSKIPNSYLFQPQSDNRQWMLKRGKAKMVYYDNHQISLLRKYFGSLGTDMDQNIESTQLEEILISIGLAKCREDVLKLIDGVTKNTKINFQ